MISLTSAVISVIAATFLAIWHDPLADGHLTPESFVPSVGSLDLVRLPAQFAALLSRVRDGKRARPKLESNVNGRVESSRLEPPMGHTTLVTGTAVALASVANRELGEG